MKIYDRFAFIIAVVAFFLAAFFSTNIYEGLPHIEDEITYVWQARLAADGKLAIESPVCPSCFLEPFVIDRNGIRFGKYPPGWPAALSLGIRLGVREYVNPFLSAFYIWLAYLLVKKLFNPITGLISTILTLFSPFFLVNSGTLLAHPWSLLLVVTFAHGWIDSLDLNSKIPKWMTITTASFSMGLLILTRPLTALGICLPFIFHGLYLLLKGAPVQKHFVLLMGILTAVIGANYFLWQYYVTGDPFLNPYVLYWPYDTVGFGPGVGLHPDGHQFKYALANTRFSLQVGNNDLFGWPNLSWLFIPFGLLASIKKPGTWPVIGIFFSLVFVYGFYWIGSWLFGPRYYYEGLLSLTMLTAAGICWLGGASFINVSSRLMRARFVITGSVVVLLIIGNLIYYLPMRSSGMRGLYGVQRSQLQPFETQAALNETPALVIVDPVKYWLEYGVLLDISSPLLDTPFIFTYDRGSALNNKVIEAFPFRSVHYYVPGQSFP